ncbi:MAG: FlaD/FlaE family flagellar protein [Methanohalobium sp.]|uniref:FlaD/FlaE family flagellar protein n=1 Tax=Methanohalobium sp. TaxID=2837493 RepID=UPI00397CE13B
MSELPWDKKKNKNHNDDDNQIYEDGSPPEPPSFDEVPDLSTLASKNTENNSSTNSSDETSTSKQAPDVILNAFNNEHMEEVDELEPVESDVQDDSVPEKNESPSFDDVPDLTNIISGNTENSTDNTSDESKENKIPSFEQTPDILKNAFNNEPMEEIEISEQAYSDENEYSAESETTKPPPFDELPDLNNIVSGSTENRDNSVPDVDESSDEMFGTDNKPLDEQRLHPDLSFDKGSTSSDENKYSINTNINDLDTKKPSESGPEEIYTKSVAEDDLNAESGTGSNKVSNVSDDQSHESGPESGHVSDKSDKFSSSFKNKFKTMTQRRNIFDQLGEVQSDDLLVAKPTNKSVDEEKSIDSFRDKIQNISYDKSLTDSIGQLRKKFDNFQIQNTQNTKGSAEYSDFSAETPLSSQGQDFEYGTVLADDYEHPPSDESENTVSFEGLGNKSESENLQEESKVEATNKQPEQQPSFEPVTDTTKNSTYTDKFNDLIASFKNKFKTIRKKTFSSNKQVNESYKSGSGHDDITHPPLFEPRIPEEMEDTGEEPEDTDKYSSYNKFDAPDEKSRFSNLAKIKPKFVKILKPFEVLIKGPSNRKSLKDQMEQVREEIDEEEKEEATSEFVPPFEQEIDEGEKGKISKIGKISGFFESITQRGGLKKRMKHFRDEITGSKEDLEFDTSTVGFDSQGQFTEQPAGLSFEQVDKLVNKKLYEHQKQVKDVFDKKIDKVYSKEYMDYIASRVSTNQAGNLQELQSKVDGSTNRVEKVTDDLQNLSNNVDELEESLREMQRRTEDFESKIDNTYYSTSERIDNIESQLKNLQDTLGISSDSNEKVSSIEIRIDEIEGALDSAQSDNQDVKAELSNIQQSISDMYNSYKDLLSHLNEVNDDYESKFSDLYDKVSKIDTIDSKISEIEKSTKYRDKSLSKFEDEIYVIKNAVKRNHKENQSLANSFEDLKQSSVVNTDNTRPKTDTHGKNVQLEHIPKNSFSMRICMEWLKYLMNQVGGNNLDEVLTYYRDLGWISENIRRELLRYSEGINQTSEKSDWKLTKKDHIKSIWFIQKLAGSNFDFDSLQNIEKDVDQIKENT